MGLGLLSLAPPEVEVGCVPHLDRLWQEVFSLDLSPLDLEYDGDPLCCLQEIEYVLTHLVHDPVDCPDLEDSSNVQPFLLGLIPASAWVLEFVLA